MGGAQKPKVDRPLGYWDTESEAPLPWSWASERLERARNYWVVLKRKNGRAYARPVWGVWLDGAFYFDSSSMDQNLATDPEVSVHLESGDEVVIVDGRAERVSDPGARTVLADAINAKYAWDWSPDRFPAPFVIRPKRAFGWCSDPTGMDRGRLFGESGTRWTF
ncbi:MAG TPA: pyridoxamine 5'-phosphate oxidase family protein [Actinomycetota bacterium]|nr:pyridoxamine 5'-phosphate oxidase family protein [Actinomycetota bacterium]